MSHKTHTHGSGESYSGIVPMKRSNEGRGGPKEIVEERPLTKENVEEHNPYRTQSRESGPSGLDRVRQAAKGNKELKFTALLHHVNVELLRSSYYGLKKQAAAGVDGVTWQEYGDGLEERLADLQGRIHRGAYHAKPSRRVWIPKPDGRQRPLGIAALEDKVVQQAVVEVLNQIWEEDFLDFSYGFRPGRSQHDALDALYTGITQRQVNYVLDLDIRSFFDKVGHDHLEKFIRHRIGDERLVRLILKWMRAGVIEDGQWFETQGRDAARGGDIAAASQSLPALRSRSLGEGMAEEAGARRHDRSALRGRRSAWVSVPSKTRIAFWQTCGNGCGSSDWNYTRRRRA